MFKNRMAFTVLESLLVLVIAAVGLLIASMMINLFHSKNNERYFWNAFNAQWHLAEYQSMHKNEPTVISFNTSHVIFENKVQTKPVIINYPSELELADQPTQIIIHPDGYVSPKTINWYVKHSKQFWQQRFQLGWGVYRLERVK